MGAGSVIRAGQRSLARSTAILVVGLSLVGCLRASPATQSPQDTAGGGPAAAPKTLRLGLLSGEEPKDGIISFSSSAVTGLEFGYVLHSGLTVYDGQDRLQPRVARKVQPVDDGHWNILPH